MSETPPPGYGPPGHQPPLRADEERLWALLCHLSYFVLGIVAPLIIMLTLGTRSPYVRHHAVEALNFHITAWLAAAVSGPLILAGIGVGLLPLVLAPRPVVAVLAAIQRDQGQLYRDPPTPRPLR